MKPAVQSTGQKVVSRVFGTLFFSVFLGMGLFMTGLMGWGLYQGFRPYLWKETPCTVVESRRGGTDLEKSSKADDELVIRYRYNFEGSDHTSDKRTIGIKQSLNQTSIQRLLMKYPKGARAVCYVNGSKPDEAVLSRGPLWFGVFIFFPLIFVAVGLFGIIGVWSTKPLLKKPIRGGRSSNQLGPVGKLVFFGAFALVGGILTYVIGVRPVMKHFASKNWPEIPCQILTSRVGSHSGSKGGTTYSVDITYSYKVAGQEFQSDTYGLMSGSSSGYEGKAKAVAKYPTGSRAVCYVNPEDPTDALLNRELSWWLLITLLPGAFFLAGAIGLGSCVLPLFRQRSAQPVIPGLSQPVLPSATSQAAGPVALRPTLSPIGKFGGAIFIALFWNGITSVFVTFAVKSWMNHKPEWFLTIFITPFVFIGLGLIGFVGKTFLGLFNPRLKLMVNSREIPLGGTLDVHWSFGGAATRVQRLKVVLEGREEVTVRSGKNNSTRTHVFASQMLIDTSDSRQIAQGNARAEVPPNLMHSWAASGNKIVWRLKAVGEIPRFPDVEDEFELTVRPRESR